ncbi:hypothetical protein U1Q18_008541 [Sarracenia purpurea var. burkii]
MMEGIPQIKARKGGSESLMEIAPTEFATYPHNAKIREKEKADSRVPPMVDLGITMSEWANPSDELMMEGTPQIKAKNKGLGSSMEIAQERNANHPNNTDRGEHERVVCGKSSWVDLGLARSEWAKNMGPKNNISLGRIEFQQREHRLFPQPHQTDILGALTKDHQTLQNIAEAKVRAEDPGTTYVKLPRSGRWKKLARRDKLASSVICFRLVKRVVLSKLGAAVLASSVICFRLAKRAVLSILGACVGVLRACVGVGRCSETVGDRWVLNMVVPPQLLLMRMDIMEGYDLRPRRPTLAAATFDGGSSSLVATRNQGSELLICHSRLVPFQ